MCLDLVASYAFFCVLFHFSHQQLPVLQTATKTKLICGHTFILASNSTSFTSTPIVYR
jgi:hypothetical protein